MKHKDFLKYLDLEKEPFALYPPPQSPEGTQNVHFKSAKFIYVDDGPTHVKIKDTKTDKVYDVALVLIEFVNPGVMRLNREVAAWNGSFV
jgi:hypothetical protein